MIPVITPVPSCRPSKCPICGHRLESQPDNCPVCGHLLEARPCCTPGTSVAVIIGVLLLILGSLVFLLSF